MVATVRLRFIWTGKGVSSKFSAAKIFDFDKLLLVVIGELSK